MDLCVLRGLFDMVTLTMNGKKIKVKEETTLLEVCREMSISIPTLCYHPDLEPHGSCRLCTVEVSENGKSRMVTACNYPAREGIRVQTHSDRVLRARRVLVELLLARCPHVPLIRDLAGELGVTASPYRTENPENNCILCGLCVRTCREMVGADAIGFCKRGTQKKIGTPFGIDSEKCVACGACESVCPTGAVRMEMDRIRKIRRSETGTHRTCRYARLGLVDYMVCSNGFECWRCEVDQAMEDRFGMHPVFALKPGKRRQPCQLNGFTFFPDYLYGEGHLWVKPMDPELRLGVDGLASTLFAEADSIELPSVGSFLKKDQVFAVIEAAGKKAKLRSPLAGTVSAVNRDVDELPNRVWKDPYRRGWLVIITPAHSGEVSRLYSGETAKEWFMQEAERLAALFKEGAPNLHKEEGPQKDLRVRQIIRERWSQLKALLLRKG